MRKHVKVLGPLTRASVRKRVKALGVVRLPKHYHLTSQMCKSVACLYKGYEILSEDYRLMASWAQHKQSRDGNKQTAPQPKSPNGKMMSFAEVMHPHPLLRYVLRRRVEDKAHCDYFIQHRVKRLHVHPLPSPSTTTPATTTSSSSDSGITDAIIRKLLNGASNRESPLSLPMISVEPRLPAKRRTETPLPNKCRTETELPKCRTETETPRLCKY